MFSGKCRCKLDVFRRCGFDSSQSCSPFSLIAPRRKAMYLNCLSFSTAARNSASYKLDAQIPTYCFPMLACFHIGFIRYLPWYAVLTGLVFGDSNKHRRRFKKWSMLRACLRMEAGRNPDSVMLRLLACSSRCLGSTPKGRFVPKADHRTSK